MDLADLDSEFVEFEFEMSWEFREELLALWSEMCEELDFPFACDTETVGTGTPRLVLEFVTSRNSVPVDEAIVQAGRGKRKEKNGDDNAMDGARRGGKKMEEGEWRDKRRDGN